MSWANAFFYSVLTVSVSAFLISVVYFDYKKHIGR